MTVVFIDLDLQESIINVRGEVYAKIHLSKAESLVDWLPKDTIAYVDIRGYGMGIADILVKHFNVIGIIPKSPIKYSDGVIWDVEMRYLAERMIT